MVALVSLEASHVTEWYRILLPMQETTRDTGSIPGLGRSPGVKKNGNARQCFLPVKSHGQRSLIDSSPWGCKESDTTE